MLQVSTGWDTERTAFVRWFRSGGTLLSHKFIRARGLWYAHVRDLRQVYFGDVHTVTPACSRYIATVLSDSWYTLPLARLSVALSRSPSNAELYSNFEFSRGL